MSTYCYTRTDGSDLEEHEFPLGRAPQFVKSVADGRVRLYRNYCAEGGELGVPTSPATEPMAPDPMEEWNAAAPRIRREKLWPMQATMSGVLASQVPDAQKLLAKHGVSCDFDRHGEPKFTSQRHQDQYCRAMGLFNKQSVTASPRNK